MIATQSRNLSAVSTRWSRFGRKASDFVQWGKTHFRPTGRDSLLPGILNRNQRHFAVCFGIRKNIAGVASWYPILAVANTRWTKRRSLNAGPVSNRAGGCWNKHYRMQRVHGAQSNRMPKNEIISIPEKLVPLGRLVFPVPVRGYGDEKGIRCKAGTVPSAVSFCKSTAHLNCHFKGRQRYNRTSQKTCRANYPAVLGERNGRDDLFFSHVFEYMQSHEKSCALFRSLFHAVHIMDGHALLLLCSE